MEDIKVVIEHVTVKLPGEQATPINSYRYRRYPMIQKDY